MELRLQPAVLPVLSARAEVSRDRVAQSDDGGREVGGGRRRDVALAALLALAQHPRHERHQGAPGALQLRQAGEGAEPLPHASALGVGVGGVVRGDLGSDRVGQVLGLRETPGGVDAMALGPPLDERLTLGGRRLQHRRGAARRLGGVVGGRRLDRDRRFVTPSV